LVCLVSVTLFIAALVPITILARFGLGTDLTARIFGWTVCVAFTLLTLPPLVAGACWLANVFIEHDEPSYADLWVGARRLFWRAVALGAVQAVVKIVILSNLVFYLSRGSFIFLLLSVLFLYLLVFWVIQVGYHYPLLVASERGLLKREDDRPTPISAILRNALVLSLASPGYSSGIAALLALLFVPCLLSGAGMALVFPGFAAFLLMHATRDQLVRFGHLEPPPDPDEPVPDERWRFDAAKSEEFNRD
jgi:hypothetical protein